MKELSLLAGKAASSDGSVAGCTSSSQKRQALLALINDLHKFKVTKKLDHAGPSVQSAQMDLVEAGELKKIVKSHSKYPLSPFELESVIQQQDYLNSDKVRASFIGDHIRYKVENCQMTLTIMDPSFMKSDPIKVSLHHQQVAIDIHRALIDCINHFFIGSNSGLYAVHYARAFDGENIHHDVKEPTDKNRRAWQINFIHVQSNLSEARAEILYWLFIMAGNLGYFPEDLSDKLGIYL
ncbi:hypothetical protein C2845_PM04G23970 [Panicum miliaceum]|uniref:Uncharacterized protein n=1 Tax=Panicum miliaceum TaxID=4540 RepID=A0A3L6QPX2_PANMI|nr:hypothetical protein C2845_PM04G23970 [Panicum miliaceum]